MCPGVGALLGVSGVIFDCGCAGGDNLLGVQPTAVTHASFPPQARNAPGRNIQHGFGELHTSVTNAKGASHHARASQTGTGLVAVERQLVQTRDSCQRSDRRDPFCRESSGVEGSASVVGISWRRVKESNVDLVEVPSSTWKATT